MGEKIGSFGSVSYDGHTITIEIDPNSLGSLALTASDERIECYWDGSQWVCNSVRFGLAQSPSQQQSA